jgi:hypothetical protein
MNLYPELKLDAANTKRRERAAQTIAKMRNTLDALSLYITNANAEALCGDHWAWKLEDAELELTRAMHTVTHDGHVRRGY